MSEGSALISLLPEAFFDLIARIAPGCLITLSVFFIDPALTAHVHTTLQNVGSIGLALSGLMVFYLMGLLFDILGDAIFSGLLPLCVRRDSNSNSPESINELLGTLRKSNPAAYPVCLKMVAEMVAVRSLLMLSILAFLFSIYPFNPQRVAFSLTSIAVLLVALCHISVACAARIGEILRNTSTSETDSQSA